MVGLAKLRAAIGGLPQALGRPASRQYVPEIDGLRCFAIMFVLVWHASLRAARVNDAINGHGAPGFYANFPHGEIGVLLFFVISGFVVSQPFLSRPSIDWRLSQYYGRRFIRIFPPYAITLSFCAIILGVVGHTPTDANSFRDSHIPLTQSFLASLVYMHGMIFNTPSRLDPPVWSLELEVMFYTIVPALITLYKSVEIRSMRITALAGLILFNIAIVHSFGAFDGVDGRLRWGLLFHAYLFLLGIGLADLTRQIYGSVKAKTIWFDLVFVICSAALVYSGLCLTMFDAKLPTGVFATGVYMLGVIAVVGLFFSAFRGRLISQILSNPWVTLIGTMCYSIYLTHIVVMQACSEILEKTVSLKDPISIWAVWLGILLPASIVFAFLFYVGVERPFALVAAYGRSKPGRDVARTAELTSVIESAASR